MFTNITGLSKKCINCHYNDKDQIGYCDSYQNNMDDQINNFTCLQ